MGIRILHTADTWILVIGRMGSSWIPRIGNNPPRHSQPHAKVLAPPPPRPIPPTALNSGPLVPRLARELLAQGNCPGDLPPSVFN